MAGEETVWRRLTRLFRSGPIVRHKIANGERLQEPQGTARAFKKELSSLYVRALASYANYERLSRYCVTGDTLVAVNLEEGNIRIDELVQRVANGEDIRVFSYDNSRDELVATPIERAVCNGEREVCEVELDDGSVIRCTPDHRFMLRDGTYREAKDLTPSTALMPFHRKEWGGKRGEYRYVYSYSRGWVPEHVIVAESVTGERYVREGGIHIHHKNFKHRDNRADNLQPLPAADHLALHARINNKRFEDPTEREKQAEHARRRWATGGDLRTSQENGSIVSERGREAHRAWMVDFNKKNKPGTGNAGRTDQVGLDNANADKSLTYQTICDAYRPNMELSTLCSQVGASRYKVLKRLKWAGFQSFDDFEENYTNHKVVAVRMTGAVEKVYDLTVAPHHNFAISSQSGKSLIIIHNSDYNEMEYTPELHSALDIYSDEATVKNDDGNVVEVTSRNAEIKEVLETLFFDILNLNFNAWSWMRHFCKFGDFVLFVDADEEHGILNLVPIPINEIEREEGFDAKDPLAVRFRWLTRGNTILENWQVVHFRLLGNDAYLPYGSSVLEPARRIWRQLILIEDAMLVYRVVRSPERRVFHIEVANTPPDQIDAFIEQVKTQLKRNTIVDNETGRVDLRYNPLSVEEDYFLPKRGDVQSQIDTLAGGQFPVRRDTLIPLLDGRLITIEQLAAEYDDGKENWVHSVKSGSNAFVPGKVVWCGRNYACDRLHRVWLDDGSYVDMAPEHPIVMRDGSSKRADEVKPGESVMPFRCRREWLGDHDYEMVQDTADDTWKFIHRQVAGPHGISEAHLRSGEGAVALHHVDFNRFNNRPDNLRWMGRLEHIRLHGENAARNLHTPEMDAENAQRMIEYNRSPEGRAARAARDFLDVTPANHTVLRVEILDGVTDDVFCMTVVGPDGEDDRHNFAVVTRLQDGSIPSNWGGLFVKNTGDIDDVRYIQSKMFAAIKIPRAYLGYEDQIGSKSTLAQEDVRFAKTIERIQSLFVSELNKIAIIHLYLLGYQGSDLTNFDITLASPSTVAEQQKLELWRMKLEVAGMAQEGVFDRNFVYRKIFSLNDKQIAAIKDGKRTDKLEDALLESIQAPPPPGGEPPPAGGPEPEPAAPGADELPNTLGGPAPGEGGGGGGEPPPVTAGLSLPGSVMAEAKFNRGSTGNRAELAVDRGRNLFSTGEDPLKLTFGTEKQTASDPYDRRTRNRGITRPFSETSAEPDFDEMPGSSQVDEVEEMLQKVSEWLNRRDGR